MFSVLVIRSRPSDGASQKVSVRAAVPPRKATRRPYRLSGGRTDGWADGRMAGRIDGLTQADGRTVGWTDERAGGRTNERGHGRTVRQMDAMFHHARSSKQNYLRQSKSAIVGNGPRQGRVKARSMSSNIPGKAGLTMSALDNQSPPKNRGRLVQGETLFCTRCSEDERSPY